MEHNGFKSKQATVQPGSSSSRDQLPCFGAAPDDGIMDQDAHELPNEIQQAAEKIRHERLSKRAKQQAQQAEHDAVVVLVGDLIGEGHVNDILMYNMLTGIRIGVRIYPLYSHLLSLTLSFLRSIWEKPKFYHALSVMGANKKDR